MIKRGFLYVLILALWAGTAAADEGMWLYNAFPVAKVKAKYGFEPTQAWLDHAQKSSVRFNSGGSGSFVSADGLTFTNHHVGADCIHELSTGGKDYMKTGFYAATRAQEPKCPNLELNVLMKIEDVTDQVSATVKPGMSDAETGVAQRSAMAKIEKDCTQKTGLRCDVITLYSGAKFHLYQYKKYTDVRLVFAPEFDTAFFGGDSDNFEYPRYDLDISFFHIYENDKPAKLDNYFKWSTTGLKEGDLIFVSGHPGSTQRLYTMERLAFLRDVQYPWYLKNYKLRADAMKAFGAQSPEKYREVQEEIFGVENTLKAFRGENAGVNDKELMGKKAAEEKLLRASIEADAKKTAEFGGAWGAIAKGVQVHREIFLPYMYLEYRRNGFRGDLAAFARTLIRVVVEKQKPNGERLREYRDSNLPSIEQDLFSTAPVYKDLETARLTFSLENMRDVLGADNPVVQKVLQGRTPAEVAKAAVEGSKLDDVALRKQLYEGGEAPVNASQDSMIQLLRSIEPEARAVRKRYDDEVDSVFRKNGGLIARARFSESGYNLPPDATFTLRLSYGAVKGYVEDGQGNVAAKGEHVPYFTTMGGAFAHAAKHDNKPPFRLAESWMKAKSKLNLSTPLNAVETADIIGGNSGSPVFNKNAEVVGIIFDGNIQSLPWNALYDDKVGRAVHVDSRGIIEALRTIYHADALANELTGAPAAATKPAAPAKKKGKSAKVSQEDNTHPVPKQ
ncbi:MAG: S46 family peptidase [Acidobacteriia bacterium]|nr:S46 family peptidase [Terriglobia bacterium]